MAMGHGSVLEHATYTLLLEGISRSCTHELVRHRAGFAYSQLSQRYVDESNVAFVMPPTIIGDPVEEANWVVSVEAAQNAYKRHVEYLTEKLAHIADGTHRRKMVREAARSVLPNATETKIVVTANIRAWRHFVEMRGSEHAEAEIRRLTTEHIFPLMLAIAPCFFGDYELYLAADGKQALRTTQRKV
jgi:thymidylate synthase (FAD)